MAFTQGHSLDFEHRLNDFDIYTLVLDYDDIPQSQFVKDAILEIWRKPSESDVDWYREATFFHRTPQIQYTESDSHLFTSYGRGLLDLIHRREIRYTSAAFAQQTGPGEDCIFSFVDQNAGPSANNGARKSDGVTQGLAVSASGGNGSDWTGNRSFRNLLDTIQEIAAATLVDFNLERVGYSGTSFNFYTAYPQLGTDRRNLVVFGTQYGNLLAPIYVDSATEEITSVAALGSGTGASRTVIVVNDDERVADSPWNLIEGSANSGNTAGSSNLETTANQQLVKGKPVQTFSAQVEQTAACQYGVHYFLGDLVRVQIDDISLDRKITNVHINISQGRESIAVQFSEFGRLG